MSVASGPNIVNSGLIFDYDMKNTGRSWNGAPTTNLYFAVNPYLDGNGNDWTNSGAGTWNYNDTTITPPYVANGGFIGAVLRISSCVVTTVGNLQVGMGITTVSPSTVYTMSIWVYQTSSTVFQSSPYMRTNVNNNAIAYFAYNGSTDSTTWPTNQWIRISATGTTQSNENGIYLSSYIGNTVGDKVYFYGFQVEQTSTMSALAAGTRSTTQALVDATNRSIATTGNLTYASDNTFSFTYSSPGYVSIPLATALNKTEGTMNFWLYPTRYNGGNGYFVNREDAIANAVDWMWIGPYSNTFYFRFGNGSDCCSNDLSFGSVSTTIPLNTWVNMCFTWKINGTSAIYKNGTLLTSRSIGNIPNTNPAANGRIGLGHDNADNYFNGSMPRVQIYNRQLSADEVVQNFNALRGVYGL